MKKTATAFAIAINVIMVALSLAGVACMTIAAVQEFGAIGIMLHRGIFAIAMLGDNPLFLTGIACIIGAVVIFTIGEVLNKR